ncbi:hypothetical protein BTVI_142156 [Pitangus sulphuratus]|nr:hypothetical protein BTVI_142156 [Pitangus sulphuratus]
MFCLAQFSGFSVAFWREALLISMLSIPANLESSASSLPHCWSRYHALLYSVSDREMMLEALMISSILLGESCDGIVLSTDDYFRQQHGYTYNAAQLGDAHDWNRKRGRCPVLGTPELDAVTKVRSHQSGAEEQNHLPWPADHAAFDAALDTIGLLGCKYTLLAHIQPLICQHPQDFFSGAALNPFIPQPVLILGVALTQVQHLAFGLVKPHEIPMGPLLELVLWMASCPSGSCFYLSFLSVPFIPSLRTVFVRVAKQAMEQGRSPVIIDNTNTQAWEMKPYVEVALEKGYRVEFHEPDTWWKFDPEELEKRNKHGVTREKIAQMLERYEYQISIPIVMNSVVPPHKNTQRPPLQRRHRETNLKTITGHLSTKAKQKKKRKRNKTMESNHTEIMKKMLHGVDRYPAPGDQDRSESEEEDVEEENSKSLCTFSKGPEDPVCEEQPNSDDESLREAAGVSRERFLVAVPEVSTMSNSALKNELPVESDSSLLIDVKPFSTENLTKSANDKEANQRQKENLCRSSFLKISNDENSIHETEDISEDYDTSLLSTEDKLESCQITCEPDLEAKLISLNSEEKEISQCYNSNVHHDVPDNNTEGKGALKKEKTSPNAWASFSVNLSTEELQLGVDTQVSLSPWSEDKFVGEQRPQKMRKPKSTQTNSSATLNCDQSKEGLVKEKHYETETEGFGNIISNGLSASPAGEVHFGSSVEARATFMQCSSEVNVSINDATPIILKRKRCRRIVNLAPKFNLPREIADHTEGGKEVPVKEDVPQESVLEVRQENFLSKDHGEAQAQDSALQKYFAPYSDTEATSSLPVPDADALLHGISHIHSGQRSSISKYSCGVCVVSRTKEEQATTLKLQEIADKTEDESEQVSSEVTNCQPDILSSVKVVSEYPEDSSMLASCSEKVNEADDPEPAEASQLEDNQDVDVKCSFLGLPLSLGFAFQLVQLFGSPGLPLESLLPDDFIVPLDWKVSKMIYLLWKTSVEEKQKANGLQNGNSLTDDIISLEDLNKNHQENQDSSETFPDVELFRGMIEGNIMTCTSTGCLDAAFHHS